MRIHSRKTAWVLAVFALLFVLASAFFPVFASHHTCLGDDCPVCLQIRTWTSVLRLFGACMVCALLCLAGRLVARSIVYAASVGFFPHTPVALKTKLSN